MKPSSVEAIQSRNARSIMCSYSRNISVAALKTLIGIIPLNTSHVISLLPLLHCSCFHHRYVHSTFLQTPHHISSRLNNSCSSKGIQAKTYSYKNVFLPVSISAWNGLPNHITAITDPHTFHEHLTDFILD